MRDMTCPDCKEGITIDWRKNEMTTMATERVMTAHKKVCQGDIFESLADFGRQLTRWYL